MVIAWSRRATFRQFIVLLLGITVGMAFTGQASAAERKQGATPAVPAITAPSGAELVTRLLANGPSDPDVPLPQPNLSARRPAPTAPTGPSLYGRQEDQGAVVGLKFPIPVIRAVH
jgi:hypothetical protein